MIPTTQVLSAGAVVIGDLGTIEGPGLIVERRRLARSTIIGRTLTKNI
jgi:hypothetical protein